jgi:hypothetical protein
MRELDPNQPDRVKYDIRQVLKTRKKLGDFKLYPGTCLWEMVVTSNDGQPVPGLNPVTGDFDPELAMVREARFKIVSAKMVDPEVVVPFGSDRAITIKVKAGICREFDVQDGNFYEVASNARVARSKIIKKYFP